MRTYALSLSTLLVLAACAEAPGEDAGAPPTGDPSAPGSPADPTSPATPATPAEPPSPCSGQFQVEVVDEQRADNQVLGAAHVFDRREFHRFDVEVAPADWTRLTTDPREEKYVPASVRFEGLRFTGAAVRFKGGYTTLAACFDDAGNQTCPKLSMKLKFNKYDKCGRFFGLRRLIFNSSVQDPSLMREPIAYALTATVGLPAGRSSHATLSVNGEPASVFVLVEAVDESYLEARFDDPAGHLYKEVWPHHTSAAPYVEALKVAPGTQDVSRMMRIAEIVEQTSEQQYATDVADYVDTETLARSMALSRAIGHVDGPVRFYCWSGVCENHNFYWYAEPGKKAWLLPWDMDTTLWDVEPDVGASWWMRDPAACEPAPVCDAENIANCPSGLDDILTMPPQCDRLNTFAVRAHRDVYRATLEAVAAALPAAADEVAARAAQIREAVAADPKGPELDRFDSGNAWLREVIAGQTEQIRQTLAAE